MNWTDCRQQIETHNAPFHPKVPSQDFHNNLLISPRHQYVFVNNPKAACTTIRKLLIDAEFGVIRSYDDRAATLHFKEFLPFLNVWQIGQFADWITKPDLFKFCVIRNPYTRLLSGYLDKIVRNEAQKNNILEALGKPNEMELEISFETFARVVCEMPIIRQDPHWRVQYYQTFQKEINYDYIGRFEQLEPDLREIAKLIGIDDFITPTTFGSAGKTSRQHATNAASLLQQYYTPELRRIVYKGFEEDFTYFKYGAELPE